MLYAFHCTYTYYAFVGVVLVIFHYILTPSNAVIENPLLNFAVHIFKVCTYHQQDDNDNKMRDTSTRESYCHGPIICTVSAGLTERLNLTFEVKDTSNWYVLY